MNKEKKKTSFLNSLHLRRNIGFSAHVDSGKTTLTERVLSITQQKRNMGFVDKGSTTTDYMEEEKKRGITIQSAAVTAYWKEHQLNIIDTPGHKDFTAEVERSLRVLDGAIILLDGKKGVEPQTKTVWNQSKKYNVSRIIFVNKIDGIENSNKFEETLESIKNKLTKDILVLQIPIGFGKEFEGIVDIISKEAYYYDKVSNEPKKGKIPDCLIEKVKDYHDVLLNKIIEFDDEIFSNYLEGKEIKKEEIKRIIRKKTISLQCFPVFCGSAFRNVGIDLVLDGIIDYLPSPSDIKKISLFNLDNKEKSDISFNYSSGDELGFFALVFKTTKDKKGRKITFVRIYSGEINKNSILYNVNKKTEIRINSLMKIQANEVINIENAFAGDIISIGGKLEETFTGDTITEISNRNKKLVLETIKFSDPVISQAIEARDRNSSEKLIKALVDLKKRDPSIDFSSEGRIIICGMGQLHLDVSIGELEKIINSEIKISLPEISYRETITKSIIQKKVVLKKQTGGSGHFASITINIEPNESNKGFEFINITKGTGMTSSQVEEVEEGFKEVLSEGLLMNYPIVDIKITLIEGASHSVDTNKGDFKSVATLVFRGNGLEARKELANKLGVILLEPIMNLNISSFPNSSLNDILGNINSRRAENIEIEYNEEENNTSEQNYLINCLIPLKETIGLDESNLIRTLNNLTQGTANVNIEFSFYKEVPSEITEEISKEKILK